jgi:hypothetical protein
MTLYRVRLVMFHLLGLLLLASLPAWPQEPEPKASEKPKAEPRAEPKAEPKDGAAKAEPATALGQYWRLVESLYRATNEGDGKVPEDVVKWAKADMNKIGTWEYRVVTLNEVTDQALETALNKLGADHWECFWTEKVPEGRRVFLRRPGWSYLQTLPIRDLLEAVPRAQKDLGKAVK